MQLPISDARKHLPDLVRRAQRGEIVEITVRGEVVARILPPERDVASGAESLIAAIGKIGGARKRRPSRDVSSRKTEHLTRAR
jgi:prevent-host-death family protein